MSEFIKTYKCQKSTKKYGLKDIELVFNKDVDFPYYGLLFAEKITQDYDTDEPFYQYISYFKQDRKKINFEDTLAFKLLSDPDVITPCVSIQKTEENGIKTKTEKYKLIYFNLNANILKPTVLYTYNPNDIVNRRAICEYTFVFDNEWIYTYEESVGVGSQKEFQYPFGPFDNIKDTLEDIEEFRKNINPLFFNSNTSTVNIDENGKIKIELETFNINGEFKTLKFKGDEIKKIPNALCSIRIIGIEPKDDKLVTVLFYQ